MDSQSQRKMDLEFIYTYPQSKVLWFVLSRGIGLGFMREIIFKLNLDWSGGDN